jgi:hypothetical protein
MSDRLLALGYTSYDAYLFSEHWAEVKAAAHERAGRKCQICGSTQRLNVHHNTYTRIGEELPTDVVVLCKKCHEKFHNIPSQTTPLPQPKRGESLDPTTSEIKPKPKRIKPIPMRKRKRINGLVELSPGKQRKWNRKTEIALDALHHGCPKPSGYPRIMWDLLRKGASPTEALQSHREQAREGTPYVKEEPPQKTTQPSPLDPPLDDSQTILITRAIVSALRTRKGGWSRAAIEAIGGTWPLKQGWIHTLIGHRVPIQPLQSILSKCEDRQAAEMAVVAAWPGR